MPPTTQAQFDPNAAYESVTPPAKAASGFDPNASYESVSTPSQSPAASVAPGTPTMQAAQPTIWQRLKAAVTQGIPKFNSDFEVASHTDDGRLSDGSTPSMQLVTPQAAMTSQEKQNNPVLTGVAEAAGGLTTPGSVATIAGTAGFGELSAAGRTILPRLLSAGFSAQALKGAYDQVPAYRAAMDAGDEAEAHRILTHIVIDGGLGILAGRHAATGGPAISDTAADVVNGGSAALKGATKAGKYLTPAEIRQNFAFKEDTPAAQHGSPVRVESPLDSPTLSKQLGGKDLSAEAVNTLQGHVGDKIPVGSTAKNMFMKAVEPVTKTINETASKMNDVVKNAPKFTTSVAQDSGIGSGTFFSDIDAVKKSIPASVRKTLSADVDDVVSDADAALNSQDPAEVLEARRQLGKRIDWSDFSNQPETPQQVTNVTLARVYRALGDKIHDEIPTTVALDKVLQPNLELKSHMKSKLGERVVDDPIGATAEHQSEFKKGKTTTDIADHNDRVTRNRTYLKHAAKVAGVGGAIAGAEAIKDVLLP